MQFPERISNEDAHKEAEVWAHFPLLRLIHKYPGFPLSTLESGKKI